MVEAAGKHWMISQRIFQLENVTEYDELDIGRFSQADHSSESSMNERNLCKDPGLKTTFIDTNQYRT
ncbi:unnamed protein product [Calypogeia fissa]